VKYWWLTDTRRLRAEKTAIERLAADEGWFKLTRWRLNEFRFSADGVITAAGVDYPVSLIYPDQFPLVPAWVRPQSKDVRWSDHQYGTGGTLCLELRPDNWVPTATGADVLRSAFNLLRTEKPLSEGEHGRVASAHRIGAVQTYDWGPTPILIGADCLERLRTRSSEDVHAMRWPPSDDVWPILIFDAVDRAQPQHPPSFDLGTWRLEVPVIVAHAEPPTGSPGTRADLAHALGLDLDPERQKGALVVVVVGAESVTPYHSPDADCTLKTSWVVLPDERGARSGRQPGAGGKKVAVVGMGSVGSKVSEMLLRSGIHNFVLVDGDVFLPANLERHTLDWRDVGHRKVNAVRRRLLHIVPGATVDIVAQNLNWQRSARNHAGDVDRIAACDLIVDATGDTPTAMLLGAIAAENQKPFVSVEVFEGGLGCVIARSIPGRDPAYVEGRSAYSAYCDTRNVAPPPSGRRRYEAVTDDGDPVVADDAAVTIAASHAARVALDILDGVASADTAWLLIGFKAGWLFTRHGDTIALDVGTPTLHPAADDDPEIREFALALATEAAGETKAPG
jgi:molybdopterin/thiamine biosynthesis adenylyltransferase